MIDDEISIVGDSLSGVYPNSAFPPFADNKAELIESWQVLSKRDRDTFLPGQGKEIKLRLLLKEYNKYAKRNNNG